MERHVSVTGNQREKIKSLLEQKLVLAGYPGKDMEDSHSVISKRQILILVIVIRPKNADQSISNINAST